MPIYEYHLVENAKMMSHDLLFSSCLSLLYFPTTEQYSTALSIRTKLCFIKKLGWAELKVQLYSKLVPVAKDKRNIRDGLSTATMLYLKHDSTRN